MSKSPEAPRLILIIGGKENQPSNLSHFPGARFINNLRASLGLIKRYRNELTPTGRHDLISMVQRRIRADLNNEPRMGRYWIPDDDPTPPAA